MDFAQRIREEWEYREERNCTVEQLNALGAEGWEVVGLHQPDGQEIVAVHPSQLFPGTSFPVFQRAAVRYILKRPKAAEPQTTAQYMDRNGAMLKRDCCGVLCLYSEVTTECPECAAKRPKVEA